MDMPLPYRFPRSKGEPEKVERLLGKVTPPVRVRIPMISTGYSDRSRPPVPTDRDHFG
jgi:hypothetical protein